MLTLINVKILFDVMDSFLLMLFFLLIFGVTPLSKEVKSDPVRVAVLTTLV